MANRTYEVMYIIDPETPGDRITKLNEAVGKLIEKEGGTVVRMDDGGMRPLAYPIQKKTEGHYILLDRIHMVKLVQTMRLLFLSFVHRPVLDSLALKLLCSSYKIQYFYFRR